MSIESAWAVTNAWTHGFCTALAEMHRQLIGACRDTSIVRVARDAGITLESARRVGVDQRDVEQLRKAGVQ